MDPRFREDDNGPVIPIAEPAPAQAGSENPCKKALFRYGSPLSRG